MSNLSHPSNYALLGSLGVNKKNSENSCRRLHDVDENHRATVMHFVAVPWRRNTTDPRHGGRSGPRTVRGLGRWFRSQGSASLVMVGKITIFNGKIHYNRGYNGFISIYLHIYISIWVCLKHGDNQRIYPLVNIHI